MRRDVEHGLPMMAIAIALFCKRSYERHSSTMCHDMAFQEELKRAESIAALSSPIERIA
jgi:hypothetical protein